MRKNLGLASVLVEHKEIKIVPPTDVSSNTVVQSSSQTSKMAQQTKGLAAKSDDLSFIPRTHMVEKED